MMMTFNKILMTHLSTTLDRQKKRKKFGDTLIYNNED